MANEMDRRDFLQKATRGAAGFALSSTLPASSYARIIGANDRVRIGVVGYSDRFKFAHLPVYAALGKELNFEITGVSDIWNRRRDEGLAAIEQATGKKPRVFRNNEEMYAAKATDAVVVSTA